MELNRLNRKGYMLVEIILASALAFGIAYFILDLTLGMKTKNDDLLVETLVNTDRTIVTNRLLDYVMEGPEVFDCSKLTISGNTILYGEETVDIINDYANVGSISCKNELGKVTIKIPLDVKQMPDSDFDMNLDYKYKIGDMIPPNCNLSVSGNKIVATYQDNDGGSGVSEYGISKSSAEEYNGENEINISKGTYYCYVKDNAGNVNNGSIEIISTQSKGVCPSGYGEMWGFAYPCVKSCYLCGNCFGLSSSACLSQSGCSLSYGDCKGQYTTYDGAYYDHYNYTCKSGYTKANNSYCYKQ